MMKRFLPFYFLALLLITPFVLTGIFSQTVHAQVVPTPTPTYDPLAEPFVPENPSDYDLGHNWYWHNCMTCHGDVGQGLTDEFRAIWPEDHQNCWEHGCHGGRMDDEGFPIPTFVPALVDESKLNQFSSQQAFYEFLKATHPPQDPGGLKDEEYQAIVKYVFSMNDRPLDEPTQVPTAIPTFTKTPVPVVELEAEESPINNVAIYFGLGITLILAVIISVRNRLSRT
jgi:hypothetical protein